MGGGARARVEARRFSARPSEAKEASEAYDCTPQRADAGIAKGSPKSAVLLPADDHAGRRHVHFALLDRELNGKGVRPMVGCGSDLHAR